MEEFQEASGDKDKGKKKDDKDDEKEEKDDEEKIKKLFEGLPKLDPEGITDRVERLTIHSTDLAGYALSPDGTALYYLLEDRGRHQIWVHKLYEDETKLLADLGKGEDSGASNLTLDKKGETLFVLSGGAISTVQTKDGKIDKHGNGGEMNLDHAAERTEMFEHAWRQVREKFHRVDLHGVDWNFYGEEYRKLLPAITNNDDFSELLGEMLGELDASHTGARYYHRGENGDKTASLGIFPDLDFNGPGIRILEVISRSPLDLLDDEIAPGTLIEKINGEPIAEGANLSARLNRLAGERTLLSLHNPANAKRWDVVIRPIDLGEEGELLYQRRAVS